MKISLFLFALWLSWSVFSEEDEAHDGHTKTESLSKADTEYEPMRNHHEAMVGPLGLPHAREGSGTSWQPDSSPMSMLMTKALGWHFMFHGNVFVGGQVQGSERGARDFNSINWLMAMASHKLFSGDLSFRAMLSLEPLTMKGDGYPLLLQSGESWKGEPIHDRQHPHDLFMELAVKYAISIHEEIGLEFYGAVAGEPALGPVAFPHRTSARSNPLAPLGHHWQDATHITFGVVTAGIFGRIWKTEASWFNGREPDENRFNIDLRAFDSFAGRVSLNPMPTLSLQTSYGFLKSPERREPSLSVHRITSSVAHTFQPWVHGMLASALVVGINLPTHGKKTAFGLIESDFDLNEHHGIFGRVEIGAKTGHDLVLHKEHEDIAFVFTAMSVGYAFRFPKIAGLLLSIGGVSTLNVMGKTLSVYYGGPVQVGGMIFANLRPADQP